MSAEVCRFKIVALLLLLPLFVGSDVTWGLAIEGLAHGSHRVSFRSSVGHVDIVLRHEGDGHRDDHRSTSDGVSDGQSAVGTRHSHRDHGDHVVRLSGSDHVVPTARKLLPLNGGSATVVVVAIDYSSIHAPRIPGLACSRVGPAAPPRSSILRI